MHTCQSPAGCAFPVLNHPQWRPSSFLVAPKALMVQGTDTRPSGALAAALSVPGFYTSRHS
jgi:hypothetical protein